ncbi:MAG: LacI family DNA-binding transcriptional regulator [Lentisphaeria bacterium]|nr:MAG: LacI family DNA-binding transcriptional regulator [Lentisphaeria bacterium]
MLAQVALRARVSTGTVSRVFNNSALIPSETRSRVLSAARELGFRPRVGVRNKQIALVTEPPYKTVMGGYVNTLTQYICFALSRANAGINLITEDRIGSLADCWFDGIIGIAWESERRLKCFANCTICRLSGSAMIRASIFTPSMWTAARPVTSPESIFSAKGIGGSPSFTNRTTPAPAGRTVSATCCGRTDTIRMNIC